MSQKTFYSVEIEYTAMYNELKLFRIPNVDSQALWTLRGEVFARGARRYIDPDTFEIISPYSIRAIMVYKQAHFFNPVEEDKPLTKEVKK